MKYFIVKVLNLNDQCVVNGSVSCNIGTFYAQNAWYAVCLLSCPIGWSCQDPSVDPSSLSLWKQSSQQTYFQKINQLIWQKISFNTVISTLNVLANMSRNDTLVLIDSQFLTYYALNSKYMYYSQSLSTLFSSGRYDGSWILIYYSAGIGYFLIINFTNNYITKL